MTNTHRFLKCDGNAGNSFPTKQGRIRHLELRGRNGAPVDVGGTLVFPLEWRRVCRGTSCPQPDLPTPKQISGPAPSSGPETLLINFSRVCVLQIPPHQRLTLHDLVTPPYLLEAGCAPVEWP